MNQYNIYMNKLVLFLLVLFISIQPFIDRELIKNINAYDMLLYKTIFTSIILISYYYFITNNNIIHTVYNLINYSKKECGLLCFSSIISISISFIFIYILNNNYNITSMTPIIEAGIILITALFGLNYNNEKQSNKQIIGLFVIIWGIYLVN